MAQSTAATPPASTGTSTTEASEGFGTPGYRAYVLSALLIVYIFNFIDRTIVNILTEPIKLSFGLEDWQMGTVGWPGLCRALHVSRVSRSRAGPNGYNRVIIIAVAVAIWSLFTALCGFAMSFLMLFLFRSGSASAKPAARRPRSLLIADYFKPSRPRHGGIDICARRAAWRHAGLGFRWPARGAGPGRISAPGSIASALASLFGNLDWSQVEGWRIAFVVVGVPGLLAVAFIVWRTITEPPRGYTDPAALQGLEKAGFGEALRVLMKKPSYRHVVIGAMLASFVGYGVGQFTTSFLIRTHGLSIQMASLLFGIILGLMAAIGVFSSGWLADRLSKRYPNALSWLPALGMAASVSALRLRLPLRSSNDLAGDAGADDRAQ